MSVLIKGMEMPQKGEYECTIRVWADGTAMLYGNSKLIDGGELVPVPPHGRLIDADAIRADIDEKRPGRSYEDAWTLTVIDAAPTIIPAEEADE